MNISIPVETRKARVDLLLGSDLTKTYIAVNGKALPYRSLLIYQEYGRTVLCLERIIDDSGNVTEELCNHPIQETIEASPLVIHTSKDGLEWNPGSA